MTKRYLVIAVGIILIFIFVLFYFSSQNITLAPTSVPTPSVSSVVMLQQDVFLKGATDSEEQVVEQSVSTTVGDVIRTGSHGRALLQSPKGHPTILDYNTKLAVLDISDEGNSSMFELFVGSLWSRTKKSAEKGEFYEIKTGNAVAVVRGTSFGLTYDPTKNITTLIVATGSVSLFRKNPVTGEPIQSGPTDSTAIVVDGGQKAIVASTSDPIFVPLTEEDTNTQWYRINSNDEPFVPNSSDTQTPGDPLSPTPAPTNIKNTQNIQPTPKILTTTPPPSGSAPRQKQSDGVKDVTIAPKSISFGDTKTYAVLTGSGFKNVQTLSILEAVPPDVEVVSDTTLRFHIGQLTPGTYDVYLLMKDQSDILLPHLLVITR